MAENSSSPTAEYFVEPIKRASQACDNCRRKKSRCPGEKPRCSLCIRLRQRCIYVEKASRPDKVARGRDRNTHPILPLADGQYESNRLSAVETKLCELAKALGEKGIVDFENGGGLHHRNDMISVATTSPSSTFQITNEDEIPDNIKEEGIRLYFEHFHNRPYPLLVGTSNNPKPLMVEYPKLVLLPLLAIGLRTCQNTFFHSKEAIVDTCEILAEVLDGTTILRLTDTKEPYGTANCH